jgi:uncharacterized phage protein gp47/JayE
MAFFIDNVKDVVQRARNAFRAETPGTDAWVWPNNIYVSAKVIGGAVWEIFGKLKQMDRDRFAMTAVGYALERHGLEYNINRKPASYAQGNVVVVVPAYPFTIPAQTLIIRGDGAQYKTTTAKDVSRYSLAATVPVVAVLPGKAGNTVYGAPMTTSLDGVSATAVDDNGIGQGADTETDDQLRARILARKRYPPMGGAEYDYEEWGLRLPGVTRVFPVGKAFGPGTVGVWFLMDDTYPSGIPQPSDVAAMQAYLDSVAPVTATVIAQAPVVDCIDITISGLSPDTQAVRESVGAELASMFRNMTSPGLPGNPFTLRQSWIWQAVGNATGENYHTVVAPATDLTFGVGVLPCLKSVTFTQ